MKSFSAYLQYVIFFSLNSQSDGSETGSDFVDPLSAMAATDPLSAPAPAPSTVLYCCLKTNQQQTICHIWIEIILF